MNGGEIVPAEAMYPTMQSATPAQAPDPGAATEAKRSNPRARDTVLTTLYPSHFLPPELANVRFQEPGVSDVLSYASLIPDSAPDPAELAAGLAAAVKHGIGHSQMKCMIELEAQAVRLGDALTPEAGMAALREQWGDDINVKLTLVRQFANKVQRDWPGFFPWLVDTRLGSYPPFIVLVFEIAKERTPQWPKWLS